MKLFNNYEKDFKINYLILAIIIIILTFKYLKLKIYKLNFGFTILI